MARKRHASLTPFVLYGLREPFGEFRYVGITSQHLVDRLCRHLHPDKDRDHRNLWVQKILRSGVKPEIVGLVINLSCEEACQLEAQVIYELRAQGHPLINTADGGIRPPWFGKHLSEEHRQKIGQAHKGRPKSEEHKRKIGESKRGKKAT